MKEQLACLRQPRSRRGFTQLFALGAAGLASACRPNEQQREARQYLLPANELNTGEPWDFSYPNTRDAAFVVKLGREAADGVGTDGDIVAFHRACPHMGCMIGSLDVQQGHLGPCPCHLSTFDLLRNGQQVFGRATQNLVQVRLQHAADDRLFATGLRGFAYGQPPLEGVADE